MSHAPVTKWQPSCTLSMLQTRATLLSNIRLFFAERHVMEVETPLLCAHGVTNPYLHSFACTLQGAPYYLQTSPEHAMKRLLAAGSGPIYQLCKAFRQEEQGRKHNPEFTLLEWYQPGYDPFALMDECSALITETCQLPAAIKMRYKDVFLQHLALDPFTCSLETLKRCAQNNRIALNNDQEITSRDDWLNLLMGHCIEPKLGGDQPVFVYHYPATQAALARLCPNDATVAERFELFYQGVELANGFYELADAKQQRARFEQENTQRQQAALPEMKIDNRLLAALKHGLPNCSGIALGIDRLLMVTHNKQDIHDVMSFTIDSA